MRYSNSLTSKNVDLSKKYLKVVPSDIKKEPLFYPSGFSFPEWHVITKEPEFSVMRWGLISHWYTRTKMTEIASKTLNVRSETVAEKASFKHLIGRKHCIVPSTGFFEYQTKVKESTPYFLYPKRDKLFSMAGIYDEYIDPKTGVKKYTFTILISQANEFLSEIHNSKKRMLIMLQDGQIDNWLNATESEVKKFFDKTPNDLFAAHKIDPKLLKSPDHNAPAIQQEFIITRFEEGGLF
jgi:putative SOS response-associated peptidase YedK